MEAVLCVTANLGADWRLGVITRTPLYHAHVRFYQVRHLVGELPHWSSSLMLLREGAPCAMR